MTTTTTDDAEVKEDVACEAITEGAREVGVNVVA